MKKCHLLQNFEISKDVQKHVSAVQDNCKYISESELLFRNFMSFNNILSKEKNKEMREQFSNIFSIHQYSLPLKNILTQFNKSPLKSFERAIGQWNIFRSFECFDKIIEKLKNKNKDCSLDLIGSTIFEAKSIFLKKIRKIMRLITDNKLKIKSIQFFFGKYGNISKQIEEVRDILRKEESEVFEEEKWQFLVLLLKTMQVQDTLLHKIEVILSTKKYINIRNEVFYTEIERYYNFMKDPVKYSEEEVKKFYKEYNDILNLIKINFMNSYMNVYSLLSNFFDHSELINFILDKLSDSSISHAEGHLTTIEKPGITLHIIQIIQKIFAFLKSVQGLTIQKDILMATEQFHIENGENLNLCFKESKSVLDELQNLITNEIEPVKTNFLSMRQILGNSNIFFELASQNKWEYTCIFKTITGEECNSNNELVKLSKMAFLFINLSQKSKEKIDEDNLKKCLKYYDFISLLNRINQVLNDLSAMSYPISEKRFSVECRGDAYPKAQELLDELKRTLNKWEEIMRNSYKKWKSFTYFTPYQFEILEDFFFNKNNSEEALSLLEYAGIPSPSIDFLKLSSDKILGPSEEFRDEFQLKERRLNMLGEKLNALLSDRLEYNLENSLLQIYRINEKKSNNEKKENLNEITFNKTQAEINLTKYLYLLYDEMPEYRQLLFCSEETQWQEVLSFTYRFLNNRTEKYTMLFPERLSYENQKRIKEELLLFSKKEKIHFIPLNIIFINGKSLILQFFFEKVDIIKDLAIFNNEDCGKIQESVKTFMKSRFYESEIIESQGPGQGKSTYIKKYNKKVIWMNIAGNISYSSFAEHLKRRIKEAQVSEERVAIAFKIHQVLDPEKLEIIMFQLMLYNKLLQGNEIISIPKLCSIKIEIQNTINRPIFFKKYFSYSSIGNAYSGQIRAEKKTLLLVCNFLSLYKEKELNSQLPVDISSLRSLGVQKSIDLIVEYFWCEKNIKNINYSLQSSSHTLIQLKIFLHLMKKQIRYFNNLELLDKNSPILVFEMLLATAQNITSSNYGI